MRLFFVFVTRRAEFYNIERHFGSCESALSIYDTKDFSLKKRIFNNDISTILSSIEYEPETNEIYLLGIYRPTDCDDQKYFVGKLADDDLHDVVWISENKFHFYQAYIHLKMMGFSKKAYEWSILDMDIEKLKNSNHSLHKLWSYYHK